jgi:hypothetical protein
MSYVEYRSNNSGGSWWLKDKDWRALERAGWVVAWEHLEHIYTDAGDHQHDERGVPKLVPVGEGNGEFGSFARKGKDGKYRHLGALATTAYLPNTTDLRKAAAEFERVTGANVCDPGCPCCGQPHRFTSYDDEGKYIASGPDNESHTLSWE